MMLACHPIMPESSPHGPYPDSTIYAATSQVLALMIDTRNVVVVSLKTFNKIAIQIHHMYIMIICTDKDLMISQRQALSPCRCMYLTGEDEGGVVMHLDGSIVMTCDYDDIGVWSVGWDGMHLHGVDQGISFDK